MLTSIPWFSRLDLSTECGVNDKTRGFQIVFCLLFFLAFMSANLDTSVSASEIKVGVAMRGLLRSLRM